MIDGLMDANSPAPFAVKINGEIEKNKKRRVGKKS